MNRLKRIKVFDNEDDMYSKNQKKDHYQEDKQKEFDCTHLLQSDPMCSESNSEFSSSSSSERYTKSNLLKKKTRHFKRRRIRKKRK